MKVTSLYLLTITFLGSQTVRSESTVVVPEIVTTTSCLRGTCSDSGGSLKTKSSLVGSIFKNNDQHLKVDNYKKVSMPNASDERKLSTIRKIVQESVDSATEKHGNVISDVSIVRHVTNSTLAAKWIGGVEENFVVSMNVNGKSLTIPLKFGAADAETIATYQHDRIVSRINREINISLLENLNTSEANQTDLHQEN